METQDETFMREAMRLSRASVVSGGGPFGAVIVRDGEIVGRGMNRVTVWNDPTAHGEVVAIRDACHTLNTFDLSSCALYTSCAPCPMCLGAIYWARLNRVYFGNTHADAASIGFDDVFISSELDRTMGERKIPFVSLLRTEALVAFSDWTLNTQHTAY